MKNLWMLILVSSVLTAASFNEAVLEAKQKHKILLVELVMEFCPYCMQMDKYILSKADVRDTINAKFIFVKLDIEKDEIPDLLPSRMTPTFYFLDETGERILQEIKGAPSKSEFLSIISTIKESQ